MGKIADVIARTTGKQTGPKADKPLVDAFMTETKGGGWMSFMNITLPGERTISVRGDAIEAILDNPSVLKAAKAALEKLQSGDPEVEWRTLEEKREKEEARRKIKQQR